MSGIRLRARAVRQSGVRVLLRLSDIIDRPGCHETRGWLETAQVHFEACHLVGYLLSSSLEGQQA